MLLLEPNLHTFLYVYIASGKVVSKKAVFSTAPLSPVKASSFTIITKAEHIYVSWKVDANVSWKVGKLLVLVAVYIF